MFLHIYMYTHTHKKKDQVFRVIHKIHSVATVMRNLGLMFFGILNTELFPKEWHDFKSCG